MIKNSKLKVLKESLKYKKSERKKCWTALEACLELYNHQWNTGADTKVLEAMEQAIAALRAREAELLAWNTWTENEIANKEAELVCK